MVASQSVKDQNYTVKKVREKCCFDICFYKCSEISCNNLCNHLYSCNCQDSDALCKHIHKIHSYCNRNTPVEDKIFDLNIETENTENVDFQIKPKFVEYKVPFNVYNKILSW